MKFGNLKIYSNKPTIIAEAGVNHNCNFNLAKNGTNQEAANYEEYTVVFSDCNFTVLKRGLQPFWNVSITLVEV